MKKSWHIFACILVVGSAQQGCKDAEQARPLTKTQDSQGAMAYQEVPFLSAEQKEMLTVLEEETDSSNDGTDFYVEFWPQAGTVLRMDVSVPSGAPPASSLEVHARTFLEKFGQLWNLEKLDRGIRLVVVDQASQGEQDCSHVTFGLYREREEAAIFNAGLTVILTDVGRIKAIMGRLTGASRPPPSELHVSLEEAQIAIAEYHEYSGNAGDYGEPELVIFDSWFATGSDRRSTPNLAYAFRSPADRPGEVPFLVGNASKVLTAGTAPSWTDLGFRAPVCKVPEISQFIFPVVVDELTKTPAEVDFTVVGGLPLPGGTISSRAATLLEQEFLVRMFGDESPQDHLKNPRTASIHGSRTAVTFEEHFSGTRVDGAYLTLVLSSTGRIDKIQARYVNSPIVRFPPGKSEADAVAAAESAYIETFCKKGGVPCETILRANYFKLDKAPELVILSPEVHDRLSDQSEHSALSYRFEFPLALLYVDAMTGELQRVYSRTHGQASQTSFDFEILLMDENFHCNPDVPLFSNPFTFNKDWDCLTPDDRIAGSTIEADQVGLRDIEANLDQDTPGIWAAVLEIDAFYATKFGYAGPVLPNGGITPRLQIYLNDPEPTNAHARAARVDPLSDTQDFVILLGRDVTSRDVLAHEYQHFISETLYENKYDYLEFGALNESFSDVFAELVFPQDDHWVLGSRTAVRSLVDPPSVNQGVDRVDDKHLCEPQLTGGCQYEWAGIPNRAAVSIIEGWGSSWLGIGRENFGHLLFKSMKRLEASDRFLNFRLKLVDTCAAKQPLHGSVSLGPNDCENIGTAFDRVGVNQVVRSGYDRFRNGFPKGKHAVRLKAGLHLHNGCFIGDHHLYMEIEFPEGTPAYPKSSGIQFKSTGASSLQWHVSYPSHDPEFTAKIVEREADVDPKSRFVVLQVENKWRGKKPASPVVWVDEVIETSGNQLQDCFAPLGKTLRFLESVGVVSSYSCFATNLVQDVHLNVHTTCDLLSVSGTHLHDGVEFEGEPLNQSSHEGHSFEVSLLPGQLNDSFATRVKFDHGWFYGVDVRLIYAVNEPGSDLTGPTVCAPPGFRLRQ